MNCEVTAQFQATFHSYTPGAPRNAFQASISLCIPSCPPPPVPSHPTVYDSNTRHLNRVNLCCWLYTFNHTTYVISQIASKTSEWFFKLMYKLEDSAFLTQLQSGWDSDKDLPLKLTKDSEAQGLYSIPLAVGRLVVKFGTLFLIHLDPPVLRRAALMSRCWINPAKWINEVFLL